MPTIPAYNKKLSPSDKRICTLLKKEIDKNLKGAKSKIWHAHPVWFLEGNPIVGYDKLKGGVRLLFWSGVSFKEKGLQPGSGKFKDASATYTDVKEINVKDLRRWLRKGKSIQWDYKNIVKRRGKLKRLA